MSGETNFNVKIPKGLRIFYQEFDVSGVSFRKKELEKALKGSKAEFGLEPEPTNFHDKNAIKIVVFKKRLIFNNTIHVVYVPKELAKEICCRNLQEKLLPRPKSLWVGSEGGIRFSVDLLGKKEDYHLMS